MRNSSVGTWEAIRDTSSLERTNLNQRNTKESIQSSCEIPFYRIPSFRMFWILKHEINSKSKGEKIVQEKLTVAIKYTDITYGLGSTGC